MSTTIYAKQLNIANLLTEEYTVYLGPSKGPDVVLGCSFDMNDINKPKAKGKFLTNISSISDQDNLETESDPQSYTYEITKVQSVEEEIFKFSLHFSGSYGIVSGSLDYQKTQKEYNESDIFYLEFESISNAKTIENISETNFKTQPISESIDDSDERMKQFIADHGSHFVRTIYYGSRLVIRAKSKIKNSELTEELKIALKALGSGWQAGVDGKYEHSKTLKNKNVEISISLMGKLISPSDSNKNPIFRVIDYDTLFKLIEDIRTGEAKIISCPIKCEVESYKYRLQDYPKCKELFFSPFKSTIAESPYGVPSGTILSWIPKLENCRIDEITGKVIEIYPPEGWTICNQNSIYNLDGQFLRGVVNYGDVAQFGGKTSHLHTIIDGKTTEEIEGYKGGPEGADNGGGSNWSHKHSIKNVPTNESEHIPPYFGVIYIIKI